MTEKKFHKYIDRYRKNNIPKEYNQIPLAYELMNDNIDHYLDISNRADGKSFNYIGFAMKLSIDHGVGFLLLSRSWSIRAEYENLIFKIAETIPCFRYDAVQCFRQQHYISVYYDGELIGAITDLNSASNLKYSSNYIADFPLIIYDEFLTLDGEYLPDEWERLKTIYGSVNRDWEIPIIKYPRILYLGNAVNFSSPILSSLDLYKPLETQELNTTKIYDNVAINIGFNEYTNIKRNLRAFDEEDDPFTLGTFSKNDYNLLDEGEEKELKKSKDRVVIKLSNNFLVIDYKDNLISLSITGFINEPYSFNQELKDNIEDSIFLDESFYEAKEVKKHNKGLYRYANNFSKDYITSNIENLKIMKIIKLDRFEKRKRKEDITQVDINRLQLEETKENIMRRMFYGY